MYKTIRADKVIATVGKLQERIVERFPNSGLGKLCGELQDVAQQSKSRAAAISKPNTVLRAAVSATIVGLLASLVYIVVELDILQSRFPTGLDLVLVLEPATNIVILIVAAVLFAFTIENRLKRVGAGKALQELRVIAHVIDMHQLTKDPSRVTRKELSTPASPTDGLSGYELARYLDYCSEMLSIVGKVAALYAPDFPDPVIVSSTNDIENLTTGLSRKIWQKIMILNSSMPHGADVEAPPP